MPSWEFILHMLSGILFVPASALHITVSPRSPAVSLTLCLLSLHNLNCIFALKLGFLKPLSWVQFLMGVTLWICPNLNLTQKTLFFLWPYFWEVMVLEPGTNVTVIFDPSFRPPLSRIKSLTHPTFISKTFDPFSVLLFPGPSSFSGSYCIMALRSPSLQT